MDESACYRERGGGVLTYSLSFGRPLEPVSHTAMLEINVGTLFSMEVLRI